MKKILPTLTDRQCYWLEHVQACEASGKSIAEYAVAQEFCAQDMYAGKSVLATARPTRFQRVQVMQAAASNQWRIVLPNGVSVAFAGEVDTRALTTVLNVSAL